MRLEKYKDGFEIRLHPNDLILPYSWKKPQVIFVNSMSDLFHQNIPDEFIKRVFGVMNDCNRHIYQVLTKRSDNLKRLSSELLWSSNIWMGVSVENEKVLGRVDDLRDCGAAIKFLSLEPLIGPLPSLDLTGIDWVIVGGESGPGARPMREKWVQDILKKCAEFDVPFFFKQWGGVNKKKAGRLLNGQEYNEMPVSVSQHAVGIQ